MKMASLQLIIALKDGNPNDVKAAAKTLNGACNSCRADLR
jgi:cytochrome c556